MVVVEDELRFYSELLESKDSEPTRDKCLNPDKLKVPLRLVLRKNRIGRRRR